MKPSVARSSEISRAGKRQIITIAGRPGSGKSTTAKQVADKLGFDHFSSGDLFREIARKQGIDVKQANISAEKNAEIDMLVDARLREIGANGDKIVIDSRMAWHWIPDSYKIFLDLDLHIAAERIIANSDQNRALYENVPRDIDAYKIELEERLDSEKRRYQSLYQVNPYDLQNYNLVIDTAIHDIDEVVEIALKQFTSWFAL